MTGPEHFAEAERLLDIVNNDEVADTMCTREQLLAFAQVHATLALATATAVGATHANAARVFGPDTYGQPS